MRDGRMIVNIYSTYGDERCMVFDTWPLMKLGYCIFGYLAKLHSSCEIYDGHKTRGPCHLWTSPSSQLIPPALSQPLRTFLSLHLLRRKPAKIRSRNSISTFWITFFPTKSMLFIFLLPLALRSSIPFSSSPGWIVLLRCVFQCYVEEVFFVRRASVYVLSL